MRGTNVQSAGVTNVVNIQDSQEQASGAIAGGEAVYTQRVNQSQKGRRYIPSVRTNHRRGGQSVLDI
eukprot:6022227-Pyramimonas_sp.AAC.3